MKRIVTVCLVLACAGVARGGPAEAAVLAAMRLSEQPNYSWIATVVDDARTYDIVGQTARDGYTLVKMPVINSVRRRLGRSVGDTSIEAIFHGNQRFVLRTDEGWKRIDELPWYSEEDPEFERMMSLNNPPPSIGSAIPVPPRPRTGAGPLIVSRRGNSRGREDDDERAYSNLQLGITHPHEDLGVIVSAHQDWHVEGDVVTGTLTDLGAQLLLVRDGQKEITPVRAAGTFKLWIRDRMVTRYQVKLEGVLSVTTRSGRRQVEVNQTVNTEVRNVGTTQFDVPDEARRKLDL